jgi:hypothetical protein
MKNTLLLIIVLLNVGISCRDNVKIQIEKIVKEWSGKTIVFPSITPFILQVNDTTYSNIMNKKIITFAKIFEKNKRSINNKFLKKWL